MSLALDASGNPVHETPVHRFPLPPPVPGKHVPRFNGNGQYILPDIPSRDDGRDPPAMRSYTRASTVAKTLDDTFMLGQWQMRQVIAGLYRDQDLLDKTFDVLGRFEHEHGTGRDLARECPDDLNDLVREAHIAAGTEYGSELGTAVHAWCEAVDLGRCHLTHVPEVVRPWVEAHRRVLTAAGLEVVTTERIVLNASYEIVGTLDMILEDHTGARYLGDTKTSRTLKYSMLGFATQLEIYNSAQYMLSEDGSRWLFKPKLRPDTAYLVHLPREDPDASEIVPFNMSVGRDALELAMDVRNIRRRATKHAVDTEHVVHCKDPDEVRRREARFALEFCTTDADASAVWEMYRDVWTPALTWVGWESLRSATANATANAPKGNCT